MKVRIPQKKIKNNDFVLFFQLGLVVDKNVKYINSFFANKVGM